MEYGVQLGKPIEDWFELQSSLVEDDYPVYDYMDSYRWADVSDPHELVRFGASEAEGCCGSMNTYLQVGPRCFLVGFNWGH